MDSARFTCTRRYYAWPSTQICAENWSGAQLRRDPTTTPGYGTDNDDNGVGGYGDDDDDQIKTINSANSM